MDYLPIFIDTRTWRCLVVGAGEIAARKIGLLLASGARPTVVAPRACTAVQQWAAAGLLDYFPVAFDAEHLREVGLVFAATDDAAVNDRVSRLAQDQRIPINVVDNPTLSTFIMPAIVDRSPVLLACSTGGGAPVLATRLRALLEALLPSNYGVLARFMARHRDTVKQRRATPDARRRFWDLVLDSDVVAHLLAAETARAEQAFNDLLEVTTTVTATATLVIVCVTGSSDDLSLRAFRAITRADLLLHDGGVSEDFHRLARLDARRVDLGHTHRPSPVCEEPALTGIAVHHDAGLVATYLTFMDTAQAAALAAQLGREWRVTVTR